ncbi:MAG: M23 family metallopeptidase [Bacteroidota bacterium]
MRIPGYPSRRARGRRTVLRSVLGLGLVLIIAAGCSKDESTPAESSFPSPVTFRFPLDDYVVEQDFGVWNDWAERFHAGEDAEGDSGTAVYAAADGEISHSGWILGYGWLITINHQNPRVCTLYGHLSTRRWKLEGGSVKKGDLIAYLGDGDEISGVIQYMPPHLHFGIRE